MEALKLLGRQFWKLKGSFQISFYHRNLLLAFFDPVFNNVQQFFYHFGSSDMLSDHDLDYKRLCINYDAKIGFKSKEKLKILILKEL